MTSSTDSSAHSPRPKEPLPKLSASRGVCTANCNRRTYRDGLCRTHSYEFDPPVWYCAHCLTKVRRLGSIKEDFPDLPEAHSNGLCRKCAYRERVPATLTCEGGCGKLLRRNGLLLADYPGTQVVVARRRCYRCYTQGDYAEGENAVPDYETHEETWIRTRVPDDLVHYFGIEV